MASQSRSNTDHGNRVILRFKPPDLKRCYVAEANKILWLLNKMNKSGIPTYVVRVKEGKRAAQGFIADIRDGYDKSIFDDRVVIGSDEGEALKELARMLKVEFNRQNALYYQKELLMKTGIEHNIEIKWPDDSHTGFPTAVISIERTFDTRLLASGFLVNWLKAQFEMLNRELTKKEDSKEENKQESGPESEKEIEEKSAGEEEAKSEEESEKESKGEGSCEKANQGKKRDKVPSGQSS